MKIGLQISSFTWPGGTPAIASTLAEIAQQADDVGFDSIWVMDHFFQIRSIGKPEEPMLEGWTTLGFLAALTKRARLGLMVGGIHYRNPGLWVKAATTLDVLSGGRAWLGIGAAWNEQESRGLGFPFPPLGERFELLEDTLRMAHGMWTGERGSEAPLDGHHLHAAHLLNSPQSITRPRPPIMIGGGGEKKTLRLVAQYADACNVFGSPEMIARKYGILDEHCAAVGRDPAEIECTVNLALAWKDEDLEAQFGGIAQAVRPNVLMGSAQEVIDRIGEYADAGCVQVNLALRAPFDPEGLDRFGAEVLPTFR